MTVTMPKTTTDLGLDILSALDFDPTPPCEHSQHHVKHIADEFASYVIITKCPKCGRGGTYNLCESGRTRMLNSVIGCAPRGSYHAGCGWVGTHEEAVIACTPLKPI